MALSFNEALDALNSTPATIEALMDLVNQVSIEATGAVTIFYGGGFNEEIHSTQIIETMLNNGEDIRVINKTAASMFLESDQFLSKVGDIYGLTAEQVRNAASDHPAKIWLYHPTEGPWADASRRFAADTVGAVRLVTPGIMDDRIAALTELPQVLSENSRVTTVEGIDLDTLRSLANGTDLTEVRKVLLNSSMTSLLASGMITADGVISPEAIATFIDISPEQLRTNGLSAGQFAAFTEGIQTLSPEMRSLYSQVADEVRGMALAGGGKILRVLGPAAVIGTLGIAVYVARDHMENGNQEEAQYVMQEWAVTTITSEVGAIAGGAIAAMGLSALAATGVTVSAWVSVPIIMGAALAGGYFGAEAGADEYRRMMGRLTPEQRQDVLNRLGSLLFASPQLTNEYLNSVLNGGQLTFSSLDFTNFPRTDIAQNAMNDIAWRYALREMNPFVVTDADYSNFNADGSLDLYSEANSTGMSETWIHYRSLMLSLYTKYWLRGEDDGVLTPEGFGIFPSFGVNDIHFVDYSADEQIEFLFNSVGVDTTTEILFGSNENETLLQLTGGLSDDYIYGGGGDDSISGNQGDDILEGGTGNDTYFFAYGDGKDIVLDTQGNNEILLQHSEEDRTNFDYSNLNGITVNEISPYSDIYIEMDESTNQPANNTRYVFNGSDLLILVDGGLGGTITIENFDPSNNAFGINFVSAEEGSPEDDYVPPSGVFNFVNDFQAFYASMFPGNSISWNAAMLPFRVKDFRDSNFYYNIEGDWESGGVGPSIESWTYSDVAGGFRGVPTIDADYYARIQSNPELAFRIYENGFLSDVPFHFNSQDLLDLKQQVEAAGEQLSFGLSYMPGALDAYVDLALGTMGLEHEDDAWRAVQFQGGNLDDTMEGHAQRDIFSGYEGEDWLWGFAGTDELDGGLGEDYIFGGDGDDYLWGNASRGTIQEENGLPVAIFLREDPNNSDYLDGGAGKDYISGGEGSDLIFGGEGEFIDHLFGNAGGDLINGDAGRDIIFGDSLITSMDSFLVTFDDGSTGVTRAPFFSQIEETLPNDYYQDEYNYNDIISGGSGDDDIFGEIGSDIIDGGDGDDYIQGDRSFDYTLTQRWVSPQGAIRDEEEVWGALAAAYHGNDVISGGLGNDTIFGSGGDDLLSGDEGDDVLIGDDFILNEADHGDDQLDGGAGVDWIFGGGGKDIIRGGDGNDRLFGESGIYVHNNVEYTMDVQGDNDVIYGDAGEDQISGQGGNDTIYGGTENDIILGGLGNDLLYGDEGDDQIGGDEGSDGIYGGAGEDILQGGADNDYIFGGTEFDIIGGGDGDDFLYGEEGDDNISGDAGDDYLEGNDGTDGLFGGDGDDTLIGGIGTDSLQGGAGNDTYILRAGDGQNINGYVDQIIDTSGQNTLIFENASITGFLQDGLYTQIFYGNNDTLLLDHSSFSSLSEIVVSGQGYSTQYEIFSLFSPFINTIGEFYTGTGNDLLIGSSRFNSLHSGEGNDTLVGGGDVDNLYGEAGDDTYIYALGDGSDSIWYHGVEPDDFDVLIFEEGISPEDVILTVDPISNASNNAGNINLHIVPTGDTIRVVWAYEYGDISRGGLDQVKFSDGTVWAEDYFSERSSITTNGRDYMVGTDNEEFLIGALGDDELHGNGGSDTLDGGADVDQLYGGDGNDTLIGGTGSDRLSGGLGNDQFIYALGDGNDAIIVSEDEYANDEINTLVLGEGILESDVNITRGQGRNRDLGIQILETDSAIRVTNYFLNLEDLVRDYEITHPGVFRIEFSDGTFWTEEQIIERLLLPTENFDTLYGEDGVDFIGGLGGDDRIYGNAGADTLYGDDGDDLLYGGDGNDSLYGGEGDDFIYGGPGDDHLYGGVGNDEIIGEGNDTIYFESGHGNDFVDVESQGVNTIRYVDVLSHDVELMYDPGASLDIQYSLVNLNTGDSIVLQGQDWIGNDDPIDFVIFSDGETWSYEDMRYGLLNGGDNDDTLYGFSTDDIMTGGAGDDHLYGRAGSNHLYGGSGNDYLSETNEYLNAPDTYSSFFGGSGDDILVGNDGADYYYYSLGDGSDRIFEFDQGTHNDRDKILFDETIDLSTVIFTREDNDFYITIGDGAVLEVRNQFSGINTGIEFIEGIWSGQSVILDDIESLLVSNEVPVANDDIAATDEDLALVVDIADLLANDTDVDDDTLTIVSIVNAINGTAVLNAQAGTITFTPEENYNGPASFDYIVEDGNGGSATATVNLNILSVNDNPVAVVDSAFGSEDNVLVLSVVDLLANDSDVDGDMLSISSVGNAMNGGVVLDSQAGTITFTPNESYSGAASFEYTVEDGNGGSAIATVSLSINALNDAPVAGDDAVTTNEDNGLVINISDLLANDSDANGDALTIASVSNAVNGIVVLDTQAGIVTFTPNTNYNGPASFEYAVEDTNGGSATATVNLTVFSINDNPVAGVDSASGSEDNALVLNVADLLANDSDVDGDVLSISSVNNFVNGGAVLDNQTGTITFTPDENYYGSASFDYIVEDSNGGSSTSTVNLTIGAVNDIPVAVGDITTTDEDNALIINVSDLLANDSDVDSDSLTISAVNNAVNGIAILDTQAGTITFTPNANYNGPASFDYTAVDGNGGSATATVNLPVLSVNDNPVAVADSANGLEDNTLVLSIADLLANDVDVDGDALSIGNVGNGVNGDVILDNQTSTITFTPNTNYSGPASFEYTVEDDNGGSSTTVVNLGFGAINDAPVAADDAATIDEDNALVINVNDLLVNDIDADGDNLVISAVTGAVNGVALLDVQAGTIAFTPNANYNGPASFDYIVEDGNGASDTATVNLTVFSINDNPVAVVDSASGFENIALVLNIADLLANDSDVDGDALFISSVDNASNGTAALDSQANTITFVPNVGYNGPAGFEYTVGDGNGGIATSVVNLSIGATNDEPQASDDVATISEDSALEINISDLLANDSDTDGDALAITAINNVVNGSAILDAQAGTITFTPDVNYNGPASFEYTVEDGNGGSATATVNLTVLSVNDNPTAVIDSANGSEDSALVLSIADLLANDSDVDGDTLSIGSIGNAVNGDVVLDNQTSTITFTPNTNYSGPASFEYTVEDGNGGSSTTVVNIGIGAINDAPVAADDAATIDEDNALVINVNDLLVNDIDVDGDNLVISAVTGAVNGVALLDVQTGTITFTPNANYNGPASFEYTVEDGNGGIDTATVNLTIASVNDNPIAIVDSASSQQDSVLYLNEVDLLANDSDLDGDEISITGVSNAVNGSVVQMPGLGAISFTPDEGYVGPASFDYMVEDGNGGSMVGTVNVNVVAVNNAPIAVDDNVSGPQGGVLLLNEFDLLLNDSDMDGDEFSIKGVGNAINGSVVQLLGMGAISFTPAEGYVGFASFEYTIEDGSGGSTTATVNLNIQEPDMVFGTDGDDIVVGLNNHDDGLIGGAGNDRLYGYSGNDRFNGAEGDDILDGGEGSDWLNGYSGDDILHGGTGNDRLYGGLGNDILNGGAGNDLLIDYGGVDLYEFGLNFGRDIVTDRDYGPENRDTAHFSNTSPDELWFSREGNNLVVNVVGTDDEVTISGWYLNVERQLDVFQAGDAILLNSQVETLVSAMASYVPPVGDGNEMPQDVREDLAPVIAEAWSLAG